VTVGSAVAPRDTALRDTPAAPFSVVVPVYNEAPLLTDAVTRMLRELDALTADFEMVICENGSTDQTPHLTARLGEAHTRITTLHLPVANYGLAMKHGIEACRHEIVIVFNIDFWSAEFARRALAALDACDIVIGSKVAAGADDRRPFFRRVITRGFNRLLHVVFGFRGTDTHGMKAFRRGAVSDLMARCVTSRSIFDTELVLRAEREALRLVEIPVAVREIRQPGYWTVLRRTPEVAWNLAKLLWTLGPRGR
jgi:glycosyltransferase involved in cell wall biosynthesis